MRLRRAGELGDDTPAFVIVVTGARPDICAQLRGHALALRTTAIPVRYEF